MTHQTVISLLVASIVGAASIAITSDEAFARGGRGGGRHMGGHHAGMHRHHHHVYRAPVRRGVALGAGAAAAGAAGAYYYGQQPQCGYPPYPQCY